MEIVVTDEAVKKEVVMTLTEAGLGLICNLILIVTLVRTWKRWRQVKHYVVFLIIANLLELTFGIGAYVGQLLVPTWNISDSTCKFLMVARYLGPFGISMAVAALAVHVLLTSVTGNQGRRLRHGVVIGLFVLLSLPEPLWQIWMFEVKEPGCDNQYHSGCVVSNVVSSQQQVMIYNLVGGVLWIFLPVGIVVVTLAVGFIRNRFLRVKDDTDSSDLVLSGLLGLVLTLCCAPWFGVNTYYTVYHGSISNNVYLPLLILVFAKTTLSALLCVGYWYCFLKRRRDGLPYKVFAPPSVGESCEASESDILVD